MRKAGKLATQQFIEAFNAHLAEMAVQQGQFCAQAFQYRVLQDLGALHQPSPEEAWSQTIAKPEGEIVDGTFIVVEPDGDRNAEQESALWFQAPMVLPNGSGKKSLPWLWHNKSVKFKWLLKWLSWGWHRLFRRMPMRPN